MIFSAAHLLLTLRTPAVAVASRSTTNAPSPPSFWRSTLLRLQGGAAASPPPPTSYSIALHGADLHCVDDMYPSRLDDRPPLFSGVSADFTTSERSPTGGLFLNTAHDSVVERVSSLGTLQCHRLLASARVTRYWMGPAVGSRAHHVPHETQFLLVELEPGGPYAVCMPLIDGSTRASLRGSMPPWKKPARSSKRGDELLLHAESGDTNVPTSGMRALYIAAGAEPYTLLRRAFAEVSDVLGTFKPLDKKVLPPSVDQFGWCTWDAFYSSVRPEGVLAGLSTLRAAGVPPRTVILDDGWQQVDPPLKEIAAAVQQNGVVNGGGATDDEEEAPPRSPVAVVVSAFTAVGAWIASRILSVVTSVFSSYYEGFVRRAPPGSLAPRIWRLLITTILKSSMRAYFESETDFSRQLSSFEPNDKFDSPGHYEEGDGRSLRALVTQCKELGVQHFYVWHALAGYWRGASASLCSSSDLTVVQSQPSPSTNLLTMEPQLAYDAVTLFGVGLFTAESQLSGFYRNLHETLASSGVDGVKIDVQAGVPAVAGGVGGGPKLARLYTRVMEASVAEHFGSSGSDGAGVSSESDGGAADAAADTSAGGVHCINCMCHSTENLYNYATTSIARASDDFYPSRPDSWTTHIINVAYNSLFLGEICLPDWDMFHSLHEASGMHAAARAIGGCPVYVSDKPGQHDIPLLRRLVLPDGSVLRCKSAGRPTRDCLFSDVAGDGVSALKVWNTNAYGAVIGAFHVQGSGWSWRTRESVTLNDRPSPLSAHVRASDAESLRSHTGPFAVWRHVGSRLEVLPTLDATTEVYLRRPLEWEVLTIVPIQSHTAAGAKLPVLWGPLGLGEMLNTGGALDAVGELMDAPDVNGVQATFTCRGPGRFYAYCQPRPTKVVVRSSVASGGGEELMVFTHDAESGRLEVMLDDTSVVRVVWAGVGEG